MDQFRQIGKVLGSLKALMVFQNDIRVNKHQCCLLFDIFNLTFQGIAEELKQNLRFEEKHIKWKALEHPLRELHRVFKEGEAYVQQCMDNKDWLAKVICLSQNTDCLEFHIHNLLSCIPIVIEAIETAGEISGCDHDEILKKRVVLSKKYEREWMDPKLFQWNFGKHYLVSQDICNRLDAVWKEDRRLLLETMREKRSSGSGSLAKQEQRLMELLQKNLDHNKPSDGKLFPSSILVSSKDYQLKRRLGSGSQFKEVQWLGESFVLRHFFGDIEPAIPEISLLSSLAHPNILQFLCGFSDEEKKECFLVMELMNKDLITCIKELCSPRRKVPFSLPVAVDLMLQIARGMEYLHSHKIYHGDLNPYNVLVRPRNSPDGYLHAKISGFGLSSIMNSTPRTSSNQNEAPFIWYAPEVLLEQEQPVTTSSSKYTEKADIYSFGMICFELLSGKVPFEDGHLQGDKMSRNIRAGERPLFPFHSPKYLTNLTKKCWHTDPTQRPSFSSICRILRYIKRFLVLNPDHSQPDPPMPLVDFCDIEAWFSKKFAAEGNPNPTPVSHIPFEMFSYRVMEKERISVNFKDRSSESGSDGNSVCGDDNAALVDDPFPAVTEKKIPVCSEYTNKKSSLARKNITDVRTNKQPGTPKGRALRPPQLTQCGRCLRMNSESHISVVMSPSRRRGSGHASDSELA
ncbi:mitogen-activated protein kinase kinase kinase 7-like [Telopea speciosissima]|uniref:mitogen-activated protein kinase kinase kinase 7-like n=1 Tax=Telopea speciosissima TaxID=54955 RepID=UPI001CC4D841|nr:mitogen-activated protein kinase kinase kinase 7-like [Telopea speciosissima]